MTFDAIIRENLMDPASAQVSRQLADARAVEDRALFDSILLGILSCVVPPAVWGEAIYRATARYNEAMESRKGSSSSESTAEPPKLHQFVAIGSTIMRGAEHIATAISRTMAQRIARALNLHKPNSRGF